jgi:hypothetical protein
MQKRVSGILQDLFGIDVRCLAIFRIAIALIVLVDLAMRSRFIVEICTDDGFLPRDLVVAPDCYFSVQMLDGSYAFQLGHFIVAGISALMLLVGYRTRLATIICWLLTVSLHARNKFLLDAGDDLLRSLLFWSLFLPLGSRYSVDARKKLVSDPQIVLSPASAGLLLQFACVYFFAGWFKTDEVWKDGTAIEYALGQTQWIRPAGEFLRQFPGLMRYLTWSVVWFELLAPWLLFIPVQTRKFRMVTIPAFWLFMLGLATTIWLHIFPLITAAASIPFLSSVIWPAAATATPMIRGAKDSPQAGVGLWNFALAIVATAMVFAQAATHRNCPFPTEERVASLIGWNPVWSMYTNLPKYAYSTSTEATLQDGSTVDLINSEVLTSERSRVQHFHQSYRIRYFLQHASGTWEGFHTRYLAQLVYLWNQSHPPEKMVVRARILGTSKQIRTSEPYKTEVLLDIGFSQEPGDEK